VIKIDNEAIKPLSVPERVRLAQDIWDSLVRPAADHLPLTKEREELLDRRPEEHRRDPDSAVAWNEVRARLESD
jgi:putative addiction module component (TIGR02574 family)